LHVVHVGCMGVCVYVCVLSVCACSVCVCLVCVLSVCASCAKCA